MCLDPCSPSDTESAMCVLVVEDNPFVRAVAVEALEAEGLEVIEAPSADGASVGEGFAHLDLRAPFGPILEGENDSGRLVQDLGLGPAEHVAGARVPRGHTAIEVRGDYGVGGGARQDCREERLAFGPIWLSAACLI